MLGELDLNEISKIDEINFTQKILPVYEAINTVSKHKLTNNKSTIGFGGAPWTLLVYMINQQSPKKKLKENFFKMNY